MRIRMKATLSGTRDGADWPAAGNTVDLPQGEAEHLVAAGLAEPEKPGLGIKSPAAAMTEAGQDVPAEENTAAKGEPETAVPAQKRAPKRRTPN